MIDRVILHCDCNAFFASVECLHHPQYRDVPMAVAGDVQTRSGIILAKNELAKKCGVVTAETIWQARKKCPGLLLVPPRHGEYHQYFQKINDIYQQYTEQVEPFGIDESWLDVTGSQKLFGTGSEIAEILRNRIRTEIGLTISVGVSFNKVFAKLGSDYKKPDAVTVITRENFRDIVWKQPVEAMIFVGSNAAEALRKIGIRTIGQLALADRELLYETLGKGGTAVCDFANGLDESPVLTFEHTHEVKSVGNGTTLPHDLSNTQEIRSCVTELCELVAGRLRSCGMRCTTVNVALKDPQFHTISRQKPTKNPTDITKELIETAMEIISANYHDGKLVRSVTVTAQNLVPCDTKEQLSLFLQADYKREKMHELEEVKDRIRKKYGRRALRYANTLQSDFE